MAAVNTTTTVVTSTSTRQGIQLNVGSQANTITVGNLVTDVTIQPYIANRIVSFYAYNMRPNQLMHIFFDSVLVDQYCAPGVIPTTISNTADYNSIQKTANWGTAIYSDANGQVAGQFNIPAATFKTGDRVLEICDVTSLSQGNDAMTTVAHATFTASNLSVTKQSVTLTTVNPQLSVIPVTNTLVTTNTSISVQKLPDIYNVTAYFNEPIAQGLTINTPNDESGLFATSIDLFFKQKSQVSNNGVTVYLCEINNGYPDGTKVLPFSTVRVPFANINISSTANVATNFKFESPVFLNNSTEYAFIVKPDSNDPDYFVYSANLGDIDITTGNQVYSQPAIGTAFYGATTTEWTALQTEYIKFNLNVAKFSQFSGDAYFNNGNTDFISAYNISYANTSVGILPGDHVFQATNTTPSTSNVAIYGILNYYDRTKGIFYVDNSTGNFTGNSFVQIHRFSTQGNTLVSNSSGNYLFDYANTALTPNSSTLVAYANTNSLYNPILDAIVPQFATIIPAGTSLTLDVKGTSNAYTIDSNSYGVNIGTETEFYDQERIVASRSNEVTNMSGNSSLLFHAKMTADSNLLSPIIDTVRHQELIITNSIDPVGFIYEEFFNTGSSKSKYVSKVITLATGQDSQDLSVTLTAFRPIGSDIQVWVKFLNGQDTDPISAKTWSPMINLSATLFSDPSTPTDYKEFSFSTPRYYGMLPTNGTITSTNSSPTITGTSTQFGTDVKVGWFINMIPNPNNEVTRKVISIANTTSLTLDNPFNNNYTAQSYFVVPPPTSAYLSANNSTQITGTITTSTTNNTIVGTGTSFNTQFIPGNNIGIKNSDVQTIVSIANSTFLTIGTPWSSAISSSNAYLVSSPGITYLNNNSNLYTTFKQFQIKIILQSNDTSKVPLLDDVRCLCLQL